MALSELLDDVIGRAVANRKIGECLAEMGNFTAALKVSAGDCNVYTHFYVRRVKPTWLFFFFPLQHQRCHLDLARSVSDHAEEQRALATIGRTHLFRYESDQSKSSLKQAEEAFRRSLAVVDDCLEGPVDRRLGACVFVADKHVELTDLFHEYRNGVSARNE